MEGAKRQKMLLYGAVMDITDFQHPGGKHIIPMIANRDASVLFEQYHSNETRERIQEFVKRGNGQEYKGMKVLTRDASKDLDTAEYMKYCVGYTKEKGVDSAFFIEVRSKVEEFMKKNYSKSFHKTVSLIDNLFVLLLHVVGLYLCWTRYNTAWEILGILMAGYGIGRAGFLMHHGNHQSSWPSPTGNFFIGMWLDAVGLSGLIWQMEHNVGHHVDPNNHEWDPDTKIGYPFMRLNYSLEKKWFHKLQFIYVPMLIAIGGIKWVFQDVEMFFNHANDWIRPYGHPSGQKTPKLAHLDKVLSKWETFVFWGGKAGLFLVRFVIPYYLIGNISVVMRQFFLPIIVASYCMEFIFIVNHNLSEAHINLPSESTDPTKKVHWADAQVITTSNWRSSSKFFNYLAGGLNHQIEHHIFPGMYFAYYWQISPIVEQVCKKHGLPYHTYPTYSSILYSCLNHLYKLGTFDKNPDDKQKSQ